MKRISMIIAILTLSLILVSCTPESSNEVLDCESGYIFDGEQCVEDEPVLECDENYVQEGDTCVYVDPYPNITTEDPYFIGNILDPGESPLILPDWIDDAVMYEVNLRQYSEEGTIDAFMEDLPRLQELGVEILWFMPIHPISLERRIDDLGSYYAVQDFYDINPEFGTLEDFEELVDTAHQMGFKVVMDIVFNHTGWDHDWITDHPDWYTQSEGVIVHPPGTNWLDVADLNHRNTALVTELAKIARYWVEEYDVDGYRFDYASGVPKGVWNTIREEVELVKEDVFFLAEDNSRFDWFDIFNSNYGGWALLHYLTGIYNNTSSIDDLEYYLKSTNRDYLVGSFPLNFTTNHDINSWEGTHEERLGESYFMMSMLTFTLPGMPLLYSGQESSVEHRLQFFTKDEINWNNYDNQSVFESFIDLKQENPALFNDNSSNSLYFVHSEDDGLFSFLRTREDSSNQVLVVANMTNEPITSLVHVGDFAGTWYNEDGVEMELHRIEEVELGAYDYLIFVVPE
jgi:glycosidase